MWGCNRRDAQGSSIETLLEDDGLVLLNSGDPTHLAARSGALTAVDLSIASPSIAPRLSSSTAEHLSFSDHVPIIVSIPSQTENHETPRKWILEKADWTRFALRLRKPTFNGDVEHDAAAFTCAIQRAAEESIPRSSGRVRTGSVPWWNPEIEAAVKAKKTAYNRFKNLSTPERLLEFKKARAKARRLMLAAKRDSWKNVVSSLTGKTSPVELWRKIGAIKGAGYYGPVSEILEGDHSLINREDIAEALGRHFECTSSSQNYDGVFRQNKTNRESAPLKFTSEGELSYNLPFTMTELRESLKSAKPSAAGHDDVRYELVKHLPDEWFRILLELYNNVWSSGTFPPSLKRP
ncbi:uncharacterized protein [Onthophagus taurus]|uniref:uncharacterized protein n=1 Tax=Onthophagus taurus TaxID=166361 RepID=UPI0039BE0B8F